LFALVGTPRPDHDEAVPLETCGGFWSFADSAARAEIERAVATLEASIAGLRFEQFSGLGSQLEDLRRHWENGNAIERLWASGTSKLSLAGARITLDEKLIGAVSMVCAGSLLSSTHLLILTGLDDGTPYVGEVLNRIGERLGARRIDVTCGSRRRIMMGFRGGPGFDDAHYDGPSSLDLRNEDLQHFQQLSGDMVDHMCQ
jgi:hypothetical protein